MGGGAKGRPEQEWIDQRTREGTCLEDGASIGGTASPGGARDDGASSCPDRAQIMSCPQVAVAARTTVRARSPVPLRPGPAPYAEGIGDPSCATGRARP